MYGSRVTCEDGSRALMAREDDAAALVPSNPRVKKDEHDSGESETPWWDLQTFLTNPSLFFSEAPKKVWRKQRLRAPLFHFPRRHGHAEEKERPGRIGYIDASAPQHPGILDAVAVQLPDVFYDEILPKLSLKDTCNLAKVNRAYRDAVWSAEGVRSLGKQNSEDHVDKNTSHDPMYLDALSGNSRAVRALLESGWT